MAAPRGIKNNNPGNLIITPTKWTGKVPYEQNTDKHFEQFTSMAYGVRALLLDLINDINVKKLNTLTKLFNVYAPSSENDTKAYIASVAKQIGVSPTQTITANQDTLVKIARAVTGVENGAAYQLSPAQIQAGYAILNRSGLPSMPSMPKLSTKNLLIGGGVAAAAGTVIYLVTKRKKSYAN